MSIKTNLEWIKPPQQARSQKTLDRILEAAEKLIREGGLDEAPVKTIARLAGSSVGAFYARFPDKEALFHCVFQRFYEQAIATIDHALDVERWEGVAVEDLVHNAVAFLLTVFRDQRGMIASFSVRASRDPALAAYGQQLGLRVVDRIHQLFEQKHIRVAHPRPREALGVLVWLLLSALEARSLHHADDEALLSQEDVTVEISRMCLAYLGTAQEQ